MSNMENQKKVLSGFKGEGPYFKSPNLPQPMKFADGHAPGNAERFQYKGDSKKA